MATIIMLSRTKLMKTNKAYQIIVYILTFHKINMNITVDRSGMQATYEAGMFKDFP